MIIDNAKFLLGGKDLEMVEIKRVLSENKIEYIDYGLVWGAKLSAYQHELDKLNTYYAVELEIDLAYYDNIIIIDHHGIAHNHKEASLLQILKLLNKMPTRDQQLIAANDARYIKGMKCLGATDAEIASIRKRDKEAQGISEKDECKGREDAKLRKVKNDISIVSTSISSFAPISDALYFHVPVENRTNKSIIYNNTKIVFYGFGLDVMQTLCKAEGIDEKEYYFGGGEQGYFGIKEDILSQKEMEEIINALTQEKEKEQSLYSSHIFMFPFRFDYIKEPIGKDKNIHEYEFYYHTPIEQRINLVNIETLLEKESWVYEPYDTYRDVDEMHLAYNEFAYFYDYSRDALYNRERFSKDAISSFFRKGTKVKDNAGKDKIVDHYEGQTYKIAIQEIGCKKAMTYELAIKGVSLRVFHTGVAILAIELENNRYEDFEDILRINDFGRRVYPQYIGDNKKKRVSAPKQSFLAEYIQIGDDEKEDFNDFEYKDVEIGKHIIGVLGKSLFTDKKSLSKEADTYDRFYIQPSLDDRMFVMSWYGNNALSKALISNEAYKQSTDWYRYVFVDGGNDATVQNTMMKTSLLAEATYDRWTTSPYYETLYGITRYSFMSLSQNSDFTKNILPLPHMKTMYFQMATLLLANRTSILRFSDEIAALVSPIKKSTIDKHAQKLENLYAIYLKYYNRLYFKEVTHQDQGIELYDIGIKQMRIANHVDKLDGKFEKLFNFANLKAEKKSSNAMNRLTKLGAVFLPPSLTVAILSMEIFEYEKSYTSLLVGLGAIVLSAGLGYWAFIKENEDER